MAQDKKSFVAYSDWKNIFNMLTDEEAGKLIKHLLSYVNDENPTLEDRLLKLAFEPIKSQLKRDLQKYETVREKRAASGKLGGRPKTEEAKKANGFSEKQNKATESKQKQSKAKKPDTEYVNDNDNDTVNDNDILLKKETKKECVFNFKKEMLAFGFDEILTDEFLKIRKAKKAVNSELAYKKFITEVQKTGRAPNEILKIITEKQWKGFEAEWITENQSHGKKEQNTTGLVINR